MQSVSNCLPVYQKQDAFVRGSFHKQVTKRHSVNFQNEKIQKYRAYVLFGIYLGYTCIFIDIFMTMTSLLRRNLYSYVLI